MTDAARLRVLLALAEARKARALAALEALVAEDRAHAEELRDLSGLHARDLAEAEGTPLPVLERRLAWAAARTAALAAARAALAPRIAAARAEATEALGKREALDGLATRVEAEDRARREARAEAARPPRPHAGSG